MSPPGSSSTDNRKSSATEEQSTNAVPLNGARTEGLSGRDRHQDSQRESMLTRAGESLRLAKQALVHMSLQSDRLASIYRHRRLEHDLRLSGMPVDEGIISSRYGYRVDPLTGRQQMHRGLDLVAQPGSRIKALADGVVTYSGRNGAYGNLLELEHANGYRTRYAHNRALLVPVGARVRKGQTIALMGSSGRSTGTHLHLEVRLEGRTLDPELYVR